MKISEKEFIIFVENKTPERLRQDIQEKLVMAFPGVKFVIIWEFK